MSATNIPSAWTIANIDPNDAMILPYDANPDRMTFSERTPPCLRVSKRRYCDNSGNGGNEL
jgi:hypothetical protein